MEKLIVKVAYATNYLQKVIQLEVNPKTSIIDIILESNIQTYFEELKNLSSEELSSLPVGIYGKKIDIHNYQIQNHDRIEIYRRLDQSPNQKRLNRQSNNAK